MPAYPASRAPGCAIAASIGRPTCCPRSPALRRVPSLTNPWRTCHEEAPNRRRCRGHALHRHRPCAMGRGRSHEPRAEHADRSEEHTSELQSLMRNSYAVFCLTTKKKPLTNHNEHNLITDTNHTTTTL